MKAITQSISGLIVTVLISAAFFGSVSGQTASLSGEQAVRHLRETGEYDSLRAAFNAARKGSGDESLSPEVSQTKLTAFDGRANDYFGVSVAISGNTAIVGSVVKDFNGIPDQGSAYVFVRNGTTWTRQTTLTASDGAAYDQFGVSVAISGDTVIVGSYYDDIGANGDQGSAYVFVRNGTFWTQQFKLTASDGAADDHFGNSVAISGETAIVGSSEDDIGTNNDQGSAYVFVRNSTTWTQRPKLTASDGAAVDYFGYSVAISGDTAIVGSFLDDVGTNPNQGSAYIFVRNGTFWTQQVRLIASDGDYGDQFGVSVAISGDTVIVGSHYDVIGINLFQGSAYVFVRNGTTWTPQVKLIASDGTGNCVFGESVAISGETAIVGARGGCMGTNNNQGSAYVFVRNGTTWTQRPKLTASDGAAYDKFGNSVAISGETVIVGRYEDDIRTNTNQGSAYVFDLTRRPQFDFDGDGKADISVFRPSNGAWYLNRSAAGFTGVSFGQQGDLIAPADFDGDGKTDVAVFRAGNWYRLNSSTGAFVATQFGSAGDIPVAGDFDGDGKADIAVFRPSNGSWYRLNSSNGQFVGAQFGANGDKPQVGDFDGDGKTDLAVFRPSSGAWYILRSSDNLFSGVSFGTSGDIPTTADYDGDGRADISVYRPSAGAWYRLDSTSNQFFAQQFGTSEDKPAAADYDGDGKSDIAVFRPSNGTWYILLSSSGFFAQQFGTSGDIPTPAAFGQ